MDPALQQLLRRGRADDVLEAILRLEPTAPTVPHGAREIARFGPIRTIRLARGDIKQVWGHPYTASLKAPRLMKLERPMMPGAFLERNAQRERRPAKLKHTGKGVVVGVIDWGFDIGHPAFRDGRGRTRVRALWDQRIMRNAKGVRPRPYGYGSVMNREMIDAALRTGSPYHALGYHPGTSDKGVGAHGTHVADIAAGSPRADGPGGLAPDAELIFVHLGGPPLDGTASLGDSVRILEAVDFIGRIAGDRPLVINTSIGTHGGPHNGQTLVERAFDAFVQSRNNTQIVQSGGNYHLASTHANGRLAPGRSRSLNWRVSRQDPTTNELEIWYSNRDRFKLSVRAPGASRSVDVSMGETEVMRDPLGLEIGRIYHRAFDPNTPDHHIDIFLAPDAPAGNWTVTLTGEQISNGRFDAWIERDRAGRRGQSTFKPRDVSRKGTTGSICNGFVTIAVGAADTTGAAPLPARFASAGPTRDGRTKPDLVAPGVRIRAARSTLRNATSPMALETRMSGASQAAPFVAGVVALCLEAGRGGLNAHDLRRAVIGTATPFPALAGSAEQIGAGLVNPVAAVKVATKLSRHRSQRRKDDERLARIR
ncbi:MAG: S8 family serine peptidase [Pseudomonadota bacterium]